MVRRTRSVSRSRALPWQPMQPQGHLKRRGIPGRGTLRSTMQGSFSPAGTYKAPSFARHWPVFATPGQQLFVNQVSMPRLWQPAPPAVHGYGQGHALPLKGHQAQHASQQQHWQQQEAPKQLKKCLRRARQRRQQRQRRQRQRQQVTYFAPAAPLLDNEFYMARAERERQEVGVRQMDYFLNTAVAAAGAVGRQLVLFAPAARLTNDVPMARAELERAEAATLQQQQQQQQAISSAAVAPLTPAAEEQSYAAAWPAAVLYPSVAVVASSATAATAAVLYPRVAVVASSATADAATPAELQQLEQQMQHVHLQEASCGQQQQDEQQESNDGEVDYTMEEVCSWYPGVQASLKSAQRINLLSHVASRQPDAPGYFSVLTRTLSDASSCC